MLLFNTLCQTTISVLKFRSFENKFCTNFAQGLGLGARKVWTLSLFLLVFQDLTQPSHDEQNLRPRCTTWKLTIFLNGFRAKKCFVLMTNCAFRVHNSILRNYYREREQKCRISCKNLRGIPDGFAIEKLKFRKTKT